ncbi:MAG: T9SS type A sorting domain-containing protein [Candidatus Cloacimonas sp.]|jgi:tetratricopeptide (TPR) repeat protein
MKKLLLVIFFTLLALTLMAQNGIKWSNWLVLPGYVFANPGAYNFHDNLDLNEIIDTDDSDVPIAAKITLPVRSGYPTMYYQICIGSLYDPYTLSYTNEIEVDSDVERVVNIPQQDEYWKHGFIYIVYYWDRGDYWEIVPTVLHPSFPTLEYVERSPSFDLRLGVVTPAFHPNLFFYNVSGNVINSTSEGSNINILYYGTGYIQRVRVLVTYQHHNGDCEVIGGSIVRDDVTEHFNVYNACPIMIPQSAGHQGTQTGTFSYEVRPEWIKPDFSDPAYVDPEHEFPYYGEINTNDNTHSIPKLWSYRQYIPDYKIPNLIPSTPGDFSNSMNNQLDADGDGITYLPANQHCSTLYNIYNNSLAPAYNIRYQFEIKKRNLGTIRLDDYDCIVPWVDFEPGDSHITTPASGHSIYLGNLCPMESTGFSLSVRHDRNPEDYKRIWDSDNSEWQINLRISYYYIEEGSNSLTPMETNVTGTRVIFLEDERASNYGFPMDRSSNANLVISRANGAVDNFVEDYYQDFDNAFCTSYGQLVGLGNRKLHTGVDIPSGEHSWDRNKLVFSVSRGRVLYHEKSVEVIMGSAPYRKITYENVQHENIWHNYPQNLDDLVFTYTEYLRNVFHDTYRNSGVPLAITQYVSLFNAINGHLHFEEVKDNGKTINPLRRGGFGNGSNILAKDVYTPHVVKNGIKITDSWSGNVLAQSYDPDLPGEIPTNIINLEDHPTLSIVAEIRDLLTADILFHRQNGIYKIDFFFSRLVPDDSWVRHWPINSNNNQITSVNFLEDVHPSWHHTIHPFGANKENFFNISINSDNPNSSGSPRNVYLDRSVFSRNGQYMLVIKAYDINGEHDPSTASFGSWWLQFEITGSGQHVAQHIVEDQSYEGTVYIDSDVTIDDGATLEFLPGTNVIVAPGRKIILANGTLKALGTNEGKITFSTGCDTTYWGGIRCDANNTRIELAFTSIQNSENIDGIGAGMGGALHIGSTAYASISDCEFLNCKSTNGGAAYISNDNVFISNSKFLSGQALYGGAVYVDSAMISLVGCYFTRNTAEYGSAIYLQDSDTNILNCTIVGNQSQIDSSVLFFDNSSSMVANTILWDNMGHTSTQTIHVQGASQPSFINCNIEGGISTISGQTFAGVYLDNIDDDPIMVSDHEFSFILSPSSPCINAGSLSSFNPNILPDIDIVGGDRIDASSNIIDIGAYEYTPNTSVVYWTQNIDSDTDWNASVVHLNNSITVQDSATLVIYPGTKVIIADGASLNVHGTVKSLGSHDNHMLFTIPELTSASGKIKLHMSNASKGSSGNAFDETLPGTIAEDDKYSNQNIFLFTDFIADPSYAVNDSLFGIRVEVYDNFDVIFRSCKFSGAKGGLLGGSVFMLQASPQFYDCSFINNSGTNGGALHADSSFPLIKSCKFINNGSHLGGAIYSKHSYIDVLNSIFDDNNAEDGGALYSESSSFNFINNTMINNTAYRGGSAFISVDSDFNALNSILYYNQASLGEQVFIDNVSFGFIPDFPDEFGSLRFEYCNIEGGVSDFVFADSPQSRGVINTFASKKDSTQKGKQWGHEDRDGGVYNNIDQDPLLDMDYSISFLSPCLDAGCNEGYNFNYHQIGEEYLGYKPTGYKYDIGAKELECVPEFELSGIISSNAFIFADIVRLVGNVTILEGVTVVIDSLTTDIIVDGNYTLDVAGTLYVKGSQIQNTMIITAPNVLSWGGFSVRDNGVLHLSNCTIRDIENELNGSIHVKDNASISIVSCIIENCATVSGNGGAICMSNNVSASISSLYLSDSILRENSALMGGAVYIGSGSRAQIEGTEMHSNAAVYGGAIAVRDSTVMINCDVYNNTADDSGGGLYSKGKSLLLLGNVFTGNSADLKGGGLCFEQDSELTEKTVMINSIVWDNTCASDSTENIYGLMPSNNGSRQYINNRIGGFSDCSYTLAHDTVDDDPMFIDIVNNNFGLKYFSSCIDGGTSLPYYIDCFPGWLIQADFKREMFGANFDIGSSEYKGEHICEISPSILRFGDVAIGDTLSVLLNIRNLSDVSSFEITDITLPPGFSLRYEESKSTTTSLIPVELNQYSKNQGSFATKNTYVEDSRKLNTPSAEHYEAPPMSPKNNQGKEISFPVSIPALGFIQLPIVFEPLEEGAYNDVIVIGNSANSEPAKIFTNARGFDDTQYIEENTVWADTVLIETNIVVKPGYSLNILDYTNVIFAKNRKLTIDHATLSIADSVHFNAISDFKVAGIYLDSSDEVTFEHIKMNKCRIVSSNTPLTISNSLIDSTQISQMNHNIRILDSSLYYSNVTMSVMGLPSQRYSAQIVGNKFFYSPYRHLISINSYPEYEITDNYLYNYQTALWLNESGHGGTNLIKDNTIKYNQYGYGIELYHSNAEICGSNNISGNYIGIAGMRNSIVSLAGNDNQPYQSIHDNIDAEIVFAADSFPPTMKYNLIFDQVYGDNCLFKVVHYTGTNPLSVENNYWGESFVPQSDLYPFDLLSFEPIWEIGTALNDLFDPMEELYHTAQYNMEIGNYLLSYDQFQNVAENADDQSQYKKPAMQMLITLADFTNQPYSELQQYYQNEPSYHYNIEIEKLAEYLANHCSIKMGDYPAAIAWFDNILDNPPTEADSIYAFIDLAYTYILMESSERYKGYVGRHPQCKFEKYEDYLDAREALVSHLLDSDSHPSNQSPAIVSTLENNYPNPFNPSTTIRYSLEKNTPCKIEVYNLRGQRVNTLVNEVKTKGHHSVVWNGRDDKGRSVASGVYFYKLSTSRKSLTKKMLLLK